MKVAALSSGFAMVSVLGFLMSAVYVKGFSETWAFTFMVIFAIMFIASMISAVKAPVTELDVPRIGKK